MHAFYLCLVEVIPFPYLITGCAVKIYPSKKLFYQKTVRHIGFKISRYTWNCIPITTTCTNSDISALGIHDEPETWRDGGGTRTGLMRDRRGFLEIFFTASTTFFTRTDFLLRGVVLSAVAPVALRRFTTLNPRPAGPLDFPPPAGGGGAFERPPPHDLGSWSP